MNTYFIIKSRQQNWEGKGFSLLLPAKVYHSFDDAYTALSGYWFNEHVLHDQRPVTIIPLTEIKLIKLILNQKARW